MPTLYFCRLGYGKSTEECHRLYSGAPLTSSPKKKKKLIQTLLTTSNSIPGLHSKAQKLLDLLVRITKSEDILLNPIPDYTLVNRDVRLAMMFDEQLNKKLLSFSDIVYDVTFVYREFWPF
jgi:hypothetical protein